MKTRSRKSILIVSLLLIVFFAPDIQAQFRKQTQQQGVWLPQDRAVAVAKDLIRLSYMDSLVQAMSERIHLQGQAISALENKNMERLTQVGELRGRIDLMYQYQVEDRKKLYVKGLECTNYKRQRNLVSGAFATWLVVEIIKALKR